MSEKPNYANFFHEPCLNNNKFRVDDCIIPAKEWAKNPDTGIPALLEQYRRENCVSKQQNQKQ